MGWNIYFLFAMIITYPNYLNYSHFFQINAAIFLEGDRIIRRNKNDPKRVLNIYSILSLPIAL